MTESIQTAEWTSICTLDEIPVLGSRRVARPKGAAVALFRTSTDKVFALLDRCPHKGGPLSQGIVFGESVACPMHNWTIGLCDGVAAAPDVGCTPKFTLQVIEGQVYLHTQELATLGTDLPLPVAGPGHTRPHAPPLCGSLPPEGAEPGWGGPAPAPRLSAAS